MEVICYDNKGVEKFLEVGNTYHVLCTWKHGYCIEKEGKMLSFQAYRFEQEQPKAKVETKKKTLFDNVFGNLK